jgi:putative membrane protein
MAALFYLPRLFVYHTRAKKGSEMDETLKVMEHKLIRIIMNPAMILTTAFGLGLIYETGWENLPGWFHVKLFLLFIMFGVHGLLSKYRKDFLKGQNTKSERFYRIFNEAPPILMVFIVLIAVMKPF